MQCPTLTRDALTLRPHADADVDALVEQSCDPESARWTGVPIPFTRADAEGWVKARQEAWRYGSGELTFVVESQGRFAGQVGLRPDGARAVEVGYGLHPGAREAGVMSAALRLALEWAFEHLDVEVVHWQAHVGNWASRRVAWATGFTVEGLVRDLCAIRGERRAAWVASLRVGDPMSPTTRWFDVPRLHTPPAVLRRHTPDDVARVAEACADPVTQAWLPDLPSPYTLADAVAYIQGRDEQHAAGRGVYWAVADPDSDALLAAVGVMGLEIGASRSGEVGYWAHPAARGRGVMTAAVRAATRHAVLPVYDGGLGVARVFARVARDNLASRRVLGKAGFTEVGVDRRGEQLRDGSVVDFVRYDVMAEDVRQ